MSDDAVVSYYGFLIKFGYLSLPERLDFLNGNGQSDQALDLIRRQGISPK